MKNPFVFFTCCALCSVFLSFSGMAQEGVIETGNAVVHSNSLLWSVEGEGLKKSYLYGTFHILPQSDFVVSEEAFQAFLASNQVVMEMDMDDPNIQLEIMKYISMEDGITLDQLLGEEDYAKLDTLLKESYGAGVLFFNTWQPMIVGAMLIKNYIEGEPVSFETAFVGYAQEHQKEIFGLETPLEQMHIFGNIPPEDQVEDLKQMLNEEEEITLVYRKMIDMYKQEDITGLYNYLVSYYDDPKEIDLLLNARNKKWISKIVEFATEDSSFFLVGAGHLAGKQGLIELLRKEGYTVSAVR